MVKDLNKILMEKSPQTYGSQLVWLMIRNGHPLVEQKYYQRYQTEITVPQTHPFQQIWLSCSRDGELLQLYPAGIGHQLNKV